MKIKGNRTSSFWLDNSYWGGSSYASKAERNSADLLKMASIRRSIANFVTIVTGQNIPVKFKTKGMSATDGKTVTISSDLTKFDTICGLALHEASHIKLTSFKLLKDLHNNPARFFSRKFKKEMAAKYSMSEADVCTKILGPRINSFYNYVEDRRIDNFIYTTAPGYQGYYDSMYDEYWNSDNISEGLQSAAMRDEVWDSYEFRVINLTSAHSDTDALKGLKEIYKILDLSDIGRLTSSKLAQDVAINMLEVVEKYIAVSPPSNSEDEDGEGEEGEGDGDGEPGDGEGKESKKGDPSDSKDGEDGEGKSKKGEDGESEDQSGTPSPNEPGKEKTDDEIRGTSKAPPPILTDQQMEDLVDAIDAQKKFLDSEVDDKKDISDDQKEMVESMEEAGTEQKEVCKDSDMLKSGTFKSCPVVVVKQFNKRILDANPFSIFNSYPSNEDEVRDGFKLGKLLGKKLAIRNEDTTLKTTRLRNGKIDDRLIHSLGYGAEQVFERTFVDVYNPLHLHISIDASGSMSGSKWNKTQTAVVAIAVAASMVSNLNVVISYRYTCTTRSEQGYGYHTHKPLVLIAYDSKKDDISKVKALFPYLHAPSGTPEGLCFEATLDQMVAGNANQDSYFINFSDGEPYFSNNQISYSGGAAYKHTKKMMDQFRARGINVLSYFIGYDGGSSMDNFKQMYGKDAVNVEVTNLIPLAKTLNKLFLKK